MTLFIGSAVAFLCGRLLGRRRLAYVLVGLAWYACLATQTAHLAHPGTDGFFGVDGLAAVQGRWVAVYWVGQVPIAAVIAVLFVAGASQRSRRLAGSTRTVEVA